MEKKICPLTFASSDIDLFCEREKCQWWNNDECSIEKIAQALDYIAKQLENIGRRYENGIS